jgi:spore germination cell wall hydrolase CwlJ-like protein
MSLRLTADGPRRTRTQGIVAAVFAAVAIVLLAAGLLANVNRKDGFTHLGNAVSTSLPQPQTAVAPLNLVKPLSTEEAVQENKERPFDTTPDTAARQFKLLADETSRDRALECLTQAVYYEAATEAADGQRAVAQVILNRMRHPGFPSTVCGVVYQGSELPTGCQFTFTCDGSLARTPIPSIWSRARKIAVDALGGHVFAAVGHATHYHADYVLPYWADSLAKQVQIGHHIFYRLRGGLGTDAAFSQRYAGKEPDLPAPPSAVAVAAEATGQAQALLNSGLIGDVPTPPRVVADAAGIAAATVPKQTLVADSRRGSLIIDNGAQPVAIAGRPKRKAQTDCSVVTGKPIQAINPNDYHAGSSADGC